MWRQSGAMTTTATSNTVRDLDRINLRLSADTFVSIDEARAGRLGCVSRNTWITEAIAEKLARDANGNDRYQEDRVSNG